MKLIAGSWRLRAALLSAVSCLAALTHAQPAPDDATIALRDLAAQTTILSSPDSTAPAREEAARRLAGRNTAEAWQVLASALGNANPGAQLAAAKALADVSTLDPSLIQPLLGTYQGTNRQVIEAATRALVNFKGDTNRGDGGVLASLIAISEGRQRHPDPVRAIASRGLGNLVGKRSAEVLVGLNASRDEGAVIRNAAADGLAAMTGLTEFGQDAQRWTQWWEDQKGKSEGDFRVDLLARKAALYDRVRQRMQQLTGELGAILHAQYATTPAAQRENTLLRYLRSSEPEIRAVGAELVVDDVRELRDVPPSVREQLRTLVGDSSVLVRQSAIGAVTSLNDPASLDALLNQLAQEQEPAVKSAIAKALAPIGSLRAVPALVRLLDDPSNAVAKDAARALGSADLNQKIFQGDRTLPESLSRKLRDVIFGRTGNDKPNTQELREAAVAGLIYLKQEDVLRELVVEKMLSPNRESTAVRVSMLRALGQLQDARVGNIIQSAFADPEAPVRLAAIEALSLTPGASDFSGALRDLLGQSEPSEDVRNAAWRVLASVFPSLSIEKLSDWADFLKNDPQRQVIVLKVQIDKLLQAGNEDDLAVAQTQIADALFTTGDAASAATYYQQALTIKKSKNAPPIVILPLIDKRLRSLLFSRNYESAALFAGQTLQESPNLQSTVGPPILRQLDGLVSSKLPADWDDAEKLIDAALAIKPPLAEQYTQNVQAARDRLVRKRGPRPATAPLPARP